MTQCGFDLDHRHHCTVLRMFSVCSKSVIHAKSFWGGGVHTTGHKQQLQWFRSYVAAVLSTPSQQGSEPTYLLQVFDLRNKLIAASASLTEVCLAWIRLFCCIFRVYVKCT